MNKLFEGPATHIRPLLGVEKEWFDVIYQETHSIARLEGKIRANYWSTILFFTLLYMRHYWILQFGELIFNISYTTAYEWLEFGRSVLYKWAKPLLVWPDQGRQNCRFVKIRGKKVVAAADCTEQFCVRSLDCVRENENFSGKYMDNTITILAVVDLFSGRVLKVSKSRPGSWNDRRVWNEESWDGKLNDDEYILGDKGFSGISKFVCCRKGDSFTYR